MVKNVSLCVSVFKRIMSMQNCSVRLCKSTIGAREEERRVSAVNFPGLVNDYDMNYVRQFFGHFLALKSTFLRWGEGEDYRLRPSPLRL